MLKTLLTRQDLTRFQWVGAPYCDPLGRFVAYNVMMVRPDEQGYSHQVCVVDVQSGQVRAFTDGASEDQVIGATATAILFLAKRHGDQQVYSLPWEGGEATRITDVIGGVKEAAASPSGGKLALLVAIKDGESVRYAQSDAERKQSVDDKRGENLKPYEVKGFPYKKDGAGLFDGAYRQLVVLDLASQQYSQLTAGSYHVTSVAWSPDSERLAVVMNRSEDPLVFTSGLYEVDAQTGTMRTLSEGVWQLSQPVYAPDGQNIACFASSMRYVGATHQTIVLISLTGDERKIVSDEWPHDLSNCGMSDMRAHVATPGPLFTADGKAVLALYSAAGAVSIGRFSLAGEAQPLVTGEREIFAFDYCPIRDEIVFAATDVHSPNDLFAVKVSSAEGGACDLRRLTQYNSWLTDKALAPVECIWIEHEGRALQTWQMLPPAEWSATSETAGDNALLPVVLQVHGGPHAMFSFSFTLEFQLMAAAGYAVVYGNPRGSSGYGQEFVDACRGDYGGGDYRDVLAILDAGLLRNSQLDPKRVGITGGSYGGFMTNWAVGHTDRFKAAVTQRSISNWISFFGVSDIGYFFTEWEMKWSSGEMAWTDVEQLWQYSPLKFASSVQTPLLILHGQDDLRCPIEQAEQFYAALKAQRKEVAFIRFPNANHDLSRSGPPTLRMERYRYMLEWFAKYL